MSIHTIIDELNESNSSNHKIDVLKKYKNDLVLQRILKMTYDKVAFTYGVSVEQISKFTGNSHSDKIDLQYALDVLENFLSVRELTGHEALQTCADIINELPLIDADIFKKVINRDLRVNIGKTQINKVFPGLITKPVYMRCDVYNSKTSKNVKFPAFVQLKADGTYREFSVDAGSVDTRSRSGESYNYHVINETLKTFPDSVYTGELTVRCSDAIVRLLKAKLKKAKGEDSDKLKEILELAEIYLEKGQEYILPREIGNGLINSDDVPHDDLVLDLWDCITQEEYARAGRKDKKDINKTTYVNRLAALKGILSKVKTDNIRVIESHEVNSLKEAGVHVSRWMNDGKEGGVLKNKHGVFKDGTSKDQLKMKLKIEADVRITGFTTGSGKNEAYFGAITFTNDEGTIQGKVGVSSMTEEMRDWFHTHRDEVIKMIMSVEFNDLTKAENNNYFALSHPRFSELREDKDETDTLERVFEIREMALMMGAE